MLGLNVLINCHLQLFCSHGKLAFMQLANASMPQSIQKPSTLCLFSLSWSPRLLLSLSQDAWHSIIAFKGLVILILVLVSSAVELWE